jgi:putative tryptophan/tyrosine transport system substrate-binding protein
MMRRTLGLLVTLAFSLLMAPLAADAQPAAKVRRIGVLVAAEPPSPEGPNVAAFRHALQHLGYVDGQTVAMEYRYALGRGERFSDLIAELVQLKVDILVVGSTPAAVAAKHATQTIPIVFVGASDPVGSGLVASLARPRGNLTGLSGTYSEGFGGKWVELLAEAVPGISRVAFLQIAAQALGLTLRSIAVHDPNAFDGAFATMTQERAEGLIVRDSVLFHTHHRRIVDLAAQHRLPAMYPYRTFVDAGGLMSYGESLADLWRRAATYVDKILKGAKPADLPIEQPMKFELVINLKTAEALGLTIPPTLLFQADEIIR